MAVNKQLYKEYRRLIKKANRRIISHLEDYSKEGVEIIPKELVQELKGIQHRKQFETQKMPLSSSIKGKSEKVLKSEVDHLKKVLDNKRSPYYQPTVKEYANINRNKLVQALETSGIEVSDKLKENINKMSSVKISRFWSEYEKRGQRASFQYSSEAVMEEMLDLTKDLTEFVNS